MLGTTSKLANFFEVEIPVVFRRKFFLDKELYLQNHPPKPRRETKAERVAHFQRLMDDNGWTRAELARQLGVSRAWVTKVLG
jgi:DNA-binding XRE family transcriptional regulator